MAQFLRTATPMSDWRSFKFTCTESVGLQVGFLALIQETVGVIFVGEPILDAQGCRVYAIGEDLVEFGEEGVLIYHAEKIIVPKTAGSATAFLPGDKVYWSGTYGDGVTPTQASGLYWIGIATEPATDDDTEVEIDLLGNKATLLE
jgi:hypothetical protein